MSVTRPTLKPELPEDELAVLLVLLGAAAPPPHAVLLLLLLLPHAASPRASAAVASARRPIGLILPVTKSPFLQDRMGNDIRCAGPPGSSPNVLFTYGHDRPIPG
jgi:hypothetical protein